MKNQNIITAVILAGGQGRRMNGLDKGLVKLQGMPIFTYVFNILKKQVPHIAISANRNIAHYQKYHTPVVSDTLPDYPGPLAGMLAAMETLNSEWFLFCPCDTPNIPGDLFTRLWEAHNNSQALVFWVNDGQRDHPTLALLHHSLRIQLRTYLTRGERRVLHFMRQAGGQAVVFPFPEHFENINTPDQLYCYRKMAP